jgi:cytochrome P450
MLRAVTYFGSNILGVEGEDHKRHRKLLASSFSERNVRLVWDVTVDIVQQLFKRWAAQGNEDLIVVDPSEITYSIALFVISRAGERSPKGKV